MHTITMQRMTKRTDQVNIRLTPEIKAELTAAAGEQHRALSNLIVAILMDWLAERRAARK
jgi:uncharacterized protein (DUF1778 family)